MSQPRLELDYGQTEPTPCEWCGSVTAVAGSVCPWSVPCPTCAAKPGRRCRRPSEHPAARLHTARYEHAEALDAEAGITYNERGTQ